MFGGISISCNFLICKVAYVGACVLTYHLILHLCQLCHPIETTHINPAQVILLLGNTWPLILWAPITAELNTSVYQTETQTVKKLQGYRNSKDTRMRIQVTFWLFLLLSLLYVFNINSSPFIQGSTVSQISTDQQKPNFKSLSHNFNPLLHMFFCPIFWCFSEGV